jgi:Domain of unknown function (DUF5658)
LKAALFENPRVRPRLEGLVWLAFVVAQVADGSLTYLGIKTFGTAIEANPLLSWYIAVGGVTTTIVGAKAFAVACGAVLHLRAMHGAIAVLTLVYLAASVWPWTVLLWSSP